jgi:hypothetical protein
MEHVSRLQNLNIELFKFQFPSTSIFQFCFPGIVVTMTITNSVVGRYSTSLQLYLKITVPSLYTSEINIIDFNTMFLLGRCYHNFAKCIKITHKLQFYTVYF